MLFPQPIFKYLLAIYVIFFCSVSVLAEPTFPNLTGRVVDEAGLLDAESRQYLISILEKHEKETSNQVVVVTLKNLQGYSIEDYGVRLGRKWAIGQQGKDNGVLLIVAPNERKVRIEVGYGLEGVLTDAYAHTIIQQDVLPSFKKGKFQQGILNGTASILKVIKGTYKPARKKESKLVPIILFFGLLMLFLFGMFSGIGRGGRGGGRGSGSSGAGYYSGHYGSGGSFGGGGFSGGGGSFGGGGSSGGW